jgi:hypothetical protein
VPLSQPPSPNQTTLDHAIVREQRVPTFTTAGLLDYIVELIVAEDEAFLLVDKGAFRRLLTYTRPGLSDKDIPHRDKVREEILRRAKMVESRICEHLKGIDGRLSFTFDAWTSEAGDPYLSVTGHYISAPANALHEWELQSEQLAFTAIEGNHSGRNIGNILTQVVDRYDLRNKVSKYYNLLCLTLTQFQLRLGGSRPIMQQTMIQPLNHLQKLFLKQRSMIIMSVGSGKLYFYGKSTFT